MALPSAPRCVVTGAAGGFGRSLALELAGRRAHLVLGDIDVAGCEETKGLWLAAGAASARAVRCDVTKVEEVEARAEACDGPIDLVVNNTGVSSAGRIGDQPLGDWRWTLEVDLFGGVLHGCHLFVPRLRAQGHGHVLNVASAAGLLCAPKMGACDVAKAGVVALSETLAGELAETRVGVTALCPMFLRTTLAASGRFADESLRAAAERLVAGGKDARGVARAALSAVDASAFYSVPMADGRWLWRLKRLAPSVFRRLLALGAKRRE